MYLNIFLGQSKWHDAFQLGSYESLNYFSHIQKVLGASISVLDQSLPYVSGGSRFEIHSVINTPPSSQCLLHIVTEGVYHSALVSDAPETLKWAIAESSRLFHSPAFRTAFSSRKRKLEIKTHLTEGELTELAILYRFQSQLDSQDKLRGKSVPDSFSSSPDVSVSEVSSIAVCARMDRSLVLGFSRVVDSAQLKKPDGKHSLWMAAISNLHHFGGSDTDFHKALEHLRKLPDNTLPSFTIGCKQFTKLKNISDTALKSRSFKESATQSTFPALVQRLTEASVIGPLHGVLPNEFLTCYEVSLLHVNVHSKVTATISDRDRAQTLLSDPNKKMTNTTEETFRQHDFSDSMLRLMHEHPTCAAPVSAFRHSFAAQYSTGIVLNHALVFLLIISLALSAASGPEVSGFVQYIRKLVSVSSIPSLTSMAAFQANVKQLAPLLWLHCNTNPSSCGLSRLGSVRITQWRRSSLTESPCFSSSQFTQNCLNSASHSVQSPGASSVANLTFLQGSATIGKNGEIIVLLDSGPKDEFIWDILFNADSAFFTAETSQIEVVATLFSPKLQHFVSFQIFALLDGGFSQSRYTFT
jgi:hypothetical protein